VVGDVFKSIRGVFVASNLHMGIGTTIGQSIRSEHFRIFNFGSYFASPSGKIQFSKNAPEAKHEQINKL